MGPTLNLVLASAILIILGLRFWKPLSAGLGKALVIKKVAQFQSQLGLIERQITLANGVSAWYVERLPEGPADGPPLVVLPGATVNMLLMGIRLERLFKSLPQRRVIVVEIPHHGRNISLDLDFSQANTVSDIAEHLERVRLAIGLDEPFDLLGYSLGGGVAAHYAVAYPDRVHRILLLAPYFHETSSETFNAKFDEHAWREIHGWEGFEEMKHFFHNWLGLHPKDAPPQFVMRGLHALRADTYPAGYWSAFFEAVNLRRAESDTFLKDHSDELARLQRPTLVIAAAQDAICDAKKLQMLKDYFGSEVCRVETVQSGHFFGPQGATVCDIAHGEMSDFLSS